MTQTGRAGGAEGGPLTLQATSQATGGSTQAYLEGLLRQRFVRELDEEENIVRSLPFYATALAATFAAMAVAMPRLPRGPAEVAVPVTLAFVSVVLLVAFSFLALLKSLVSRRMLDISSESDILRAAAETAAEVARAYPTASQAEQDAIVLARVRGYLIAELAYAAESNRAKHRVRKTWRNRAFIALVLGLMMTFTALVATLAAG